MLKLPGQGYIKYLYENEDYSISQISKTLGIDWRTAKKYAPQENLNISIKPTQASKCRGLSNA